MRSAKILFGFIWAYVCVFKVLPYIVYLAYDERTHAIKEYGPIIHEFDPYFNLRATEYLYAHGWKKFVTWFDYQSWYPLGRPVGTTIYPGMQVTAVFIKNHIMPKMSLNDVCVYIPAWFGSIATVFTGLIAYECSLPSFDGDGSNNDNADADGAPFGSILENLPIVSWLYSKIALPLFALCLKIITMIFGSDLGLSTTTSLPSVYKQRKVAEFSSPAVECGLIAAFVMSVVPAHMMRSIGGGYDNESIANTSMTMTFYFWVRCMRGSVDFKGWSTMFWATIAGISYFYMAAVWGGYVFVINLIGMHAGILVLLGRFGQKLHRAYSIFYIVGTLLAIQVPVIGWTPFKSLEQLGPAAVFVGFQFLAFCEYQKKKRNLTTMQTWKLRIMVAITAALAVVAVAFVLNNYFGYFVPVSSRVRALFVKHTKTGNPLVDSVAEHQAAQADSYSRYLGESIVAIAPYGFALVAFRYFHDSSSFLLVYGLATYFFSHKMVRLILLTAPIASAFVGIALGRAFSFFLYNTIGFSPSFFDILLIDDEDKSEDKVKSDTKKVENSPKKKKKDDKEKTEDVDGKSKNKKYLNAARSLACKLVSGYAAYHIFKHHVLPPTEGFLDTCHQIAKGMSNPTIIIKGTLKSGKEVLVDDYRECYWWLRDNTPKDARVMAWWDYGYQITAIANRTTIADGNTWNHEHIALLGRALTSSEKEGHRIARHLADYVLVWSGGGGDDLAKSPHLARIANSVYRSMCPNDPTCTRFGMTRTGPSKMMRESLLFQLVGHGLKEGVMADPNRFTHKFSSKYNKCRVFKVQSVSQESKKWVADVKNRDCDAPGSWFCRGQYPPGMQKILREKRDFAQLEDFNKKADDDSEYQKKYFENLNRKQGGSPPSSPPTGKAWKPSREVSPAQIEALNKKWENTEHTNALWEMINKNEWRAFMEVVKETPELAHLRSADGRGPMWWAYEVENEKIIRVLKKLGVVDTFKDAEGMRPIQLQMNTKAGSEL